MPVLDIANQKFGRLTVVQRMPRSSKRDVKHDTSALWLCQCDCGGDIVTRRSLLRAGRVRSCGCLRIENSRKSGLTRRLPGTQTAQKRILYRYRRGAQSRNIDFCLTNEQFFELLDKPCHYCGVLPASETWTGRFKVKAHVLRHGGIDRVDNKKGYVSDNCVPCCSDCNFAKHDLSLDEFKSSIRRRYVRLRQGKF